MISDICNEYWRKNQKKKHVTAIDFLQWKTQNKTNVTLLTNQNTCHKHNAYTRKRYINEKETEYSVVTYEASFELF